MSTNAKTITVKAGGNGPVLLPSGIGRVYDPATQLPVDRVGDVPLEVPDCRFIRRRLEVGDLVRVSTLPTYEEE